MKIDSKQVTKLLYEALKDAQEHLEYCGYGDNYERECARDEGLPEKIAEALHAYEAMEGK